MSAFWEKLKLNKILSGLYFSPKEISLAKAVIFARLISPGSELHTFKWLQKRSSLMELLKYDLSEIGKDAYYEISDLIYQYKDEIEKKIRKRLVKNYSLKDTIYLYDLTNTYFEGTMSKSQSAEFGCSKEKRYDCRLVTLALVVDNAGFPVYSKIYDGNQSEPETLPEILEKVISKNNKAVEKDYSIIMDRGIATKKNIDFLKENGYSYFVVERRNVTKNYKQEFSQKDELFTKYQTSDKKDVYMKKMEEKDFDRVLVYSEGKAKKEESIIGKKEQRFIEDAKRLIKSNKKGYIKAQSKINIRIGRLKERYGAIAGIYYFKLIATKKNSKKISEIQLKKNKSKKPKKSEFAGCYVIETDRKGYTAKEIWDLYMQLNKVESAFRSMKSELGTRPIYHQLDSRINSHIFISVIAYAILHSIRYELKNYKINHSWNELKDILSTHQRATIKLKDKNNSVNYIRVSSEPNDEQSEIYNCLGINFKPNRKIKKVKFSL
ncbi:MAG: IS1634 family transposase [Candidatus Cloacimonadota bacterium]|nr:IS1634 family transposase [Candidatus Cloacimonadota bacterium]